MMSSAELLERPVSPSVETRTTKRLSPVRLEELVNPLEDERTWLGRMLGAFRVARRIGRGRTSTVYLGEHVSIGSQVAIKLLHPHLAVEPREVARFYAEARALSLAAHENIVTIFDTGAAGPNQHYLIMEHLQGRTLAQLAAGGPVPPQVAVSILTQLCDALAVGHQRGLVHRDLRPENVLLVRRGGSEHFVKLLDFGTAALGPDAPAAQPADGRIDLYSVGVMAYRLLTGRSAGAEAGRRLPPREVNPQLPNALAGVVERALAERPEERFGTAVELRAALLGALGAAFPEAAARSARARPAAEGGAPVSSEEPTPHTPMPAPLRERRGGGPRLAALLFLGNGTQLGPLCGIELTRGGFFACCDGELPPLLSRPRMSLVLPGGQEVSAVGEVVRHVDASLARAWGMPAGFGVQFVEVTQELKDAIDCALRGRPTPPPRQVDAPSDDAEAEPLLRQVLARDAADPYAFLGVARDAGVPDVHQRGREEQRRLEALRARSLSPAQQERLQVCLDRVAWALATLGQAETRADYDARIGNFAGVARCVAAGMRIDDIEARRKRFLEARRGADTRATVYALTARSYEAQGQWEKALAHYEQALAQDPFNLALHRRYWALKRDSRRPEAMAAQATS